jgi:hypothetical protein
MGCGNSKRDHQERYQSSIAIIEQLFEDTRSDHRRAELLRLLYNVHRLYHYWSNKTVYIALENDIFSKFLEKIGNDIINPNNLEHEILECLETEIENENKKKRIGYVEL